MDESRAPQATQSTAAMTRDVVHGPWPGTARRRLLPAAQPPPGRRRWRHCATPTLTVTNGATGDALCAMRSASTACDASLGQRQRAGAGLMRQQQRELLAAQSGHQIGGPGGALAQHRSDATQAFVAGRVAVVVVVALEVVDIDQQQRQRYAVASGPRHLLGQAQVEGAAIGQTGQRSRCATGSTGPRSTAPAGRSTRSARSRVASAR